MKSAPVVPSTSGTSSPPSSCSSIWPVSQPTLNSLGWTEHVLPDTTAYYTHNAMRVTTDADLRSPAKLKAVTAYLDRKLPAEMSLPPDRWELWLRDAGTMRDDFVPIRNWVNHGARTLSFDPPPDNDERGAPDAIANDDSAYKVILFGSWLMIPARTRPRISILVVYGDSPRAYSTPVQRSYGRT